MAPTDYMERVLKGKSIQGKTHLFLIAGPVGHLQIPIQKVQAQLVNRWFEEIVFHQAKEKREIT